MHANMCFRQPSGGVFVDSSKEMEKRVNYKKPKPVISTGAAPCSNRQASPRWHMPVCKISSSERAQHKDKGRRTKKAGEDGFPRPTLFMYVHPHILPLLVHCQQGMSLQGGSRSARDEMLMVSSCE